ncbi:MAG: alpha/beta hydrolase [Candidatus Thorarchaeota archaeon]
MAKENLIISRFKINVAKSKKGKPKPLSALLISTKDENLIKSKNTIVIICHGFSDTKESLQFFYLALVSQGYIILTYDARGTKGSKKVGKKHQFIDRIEDYKKVIKWIRKQDSLKLKHIFSVGFSIGAMTILCGSFADKQVSKIVAISSLSSFRENLRNFNPIILLNYLLKGVNIFPRDDKNRQLSPYHIMSELKKKLPYNEWESYANRVLLIHAKNDKVIKYFNFKQNRDLLELSPQNLLIFKKGGHTQKKNELALVGKTLSFLAF